MDERAPGPTETILEWATRVVLAGGNPAVLLAQYGYDVTSEDVATWVATGEAPEWTDLPGYYLDRADRIADSAVDFVDGARRTADSVVYVVWGALAIMVGAYVVSRLRG